MNGSPHASRPGRHVLLAVVLGAASLAGCTSEPKAPSPAAQAPDPGIAHVHGLGVDPADGVLYAATHYGLFRLPEKGKPVRVAERFQDTMGFTVVGSGDFLGSGHPDFRMDRHLPARLGLIRSTDAGETWSNVSLSGEADFHTLRYAHGLVYGSDSGTGRLMVSQDAGRTWEVRSVLGLRDFIVSPSDPDILLATTSSGLVRSLDGGRTWTDLSGAPALVVLAWAEQSTLFGAAVDGTVSRSSDGGTTWSAVGGVGGQPEAAAAAGGTLYIGVSGRGVLASTDNGVSFSLRYAA